MPELARRLSCPVCLGVIMDRVAVGEKQPIHLDHCRRCGGVWFEQGEVQGLRTQSQSEFQLKVRPPEKADIEGQCHKCHAPLSRSAEKCLACDQPNLLDCPHCDKPMKVVWHDALRLDVCSDCKGVWFDHHELESLWSPRFDMALARRSLSRRDTGLTAGEVGTEVLFNTLFFAPDLLYYGGAAVGEVAAGAGSLLTNAPEIISATPEIAAGVIDSVGEAAGGVFDVILSIIGGIFE